VYTCDTQLLRLVVQAGSTAGMHLLVCNAPGLPWLAAIAVAQREDLQGIARHMLLGWTKAELAITE